MYYQNDFWFNLSFVLRFSKENSLSPCQFIHIFGKKQQSLTDKIVSFLTFDGEFEASDEENGPGKSTRSAEKPQTPSGHSPDSIIVLFSANESYFGKKPSQNEA